MGDEARWAVVDGDRLRVVRGEPHDTTLVPTGETIPLGEAALLPPAPAGKIVAIARNYRAHAAELGNAVPEEAPLFFFKPPTSLLPTEGAIEIPPDAGRVEYEGELAVVIGKRGRRIPAERALEHVLGYTCLIDVTARELQKKLGHFSQAKGYDTFCPLGPWLETDLDPHDLEIETRKNGERVQHGRTSQMVHSLERLIAYVSGVFTLEPYDVIATGTPEGVGPLLPGDQIEVQIQGIGTLRNVVGELTPTRPRAW